MNIIKQIKLYREVKDYMAKNPKAVCSSYKLNCEYGAVDASYQLNMDDKHVNVTEYEKHSLHPITYKVSVIYKNDAEETYTGALAKKLYMLMSGKRFIQNTATFGFGR